MMRDGKPIQSGSEVIPGIRPITAYPWQNSDPYLNACNYMFPLVKIPISEMAYNIFCKMDFR